MLVSYWQNDPLKRHQNLFQLLQDSCKTNTKKNNRLKPTNCRTVSVRQISNLLSNIHNHYLVYAFYLNLKLQIFVHITVNSTHCIAYLIIYKDNHNKMTSRYFNSAIHSSKIIAFHNKTLTRRSPAADKWKDITYVTSRTSPVWSFHVEGRNLTPESHRSG